MQKYRAIFKQFGYSTSASANPLIPILEADIRRQGPITFPAFWQKALLHEQYGYYMKRDVFNKRGDFITSVEISQIFCELIGIWIIYALQQIGVVDKATQKQLGKFHLLEFGPGLGTLQCEVINVLDQFNLLSDLQITFIEYSDFMRKKQQENIVKQLQKHGVYMKYEYKENNKTQMERFSSDRVQLRWFKLYEQMLFEDYGDYVLKPNSTPLNKLLSGAPLVMIAHEFFDALPVHIFEYTQQGWCERMVDCSVGGFRFVTKKTENIDKILKPDQRFSSDVKQQIKEGDTIEVSAQGAVIMNSVAELIQKVGGCGLVVDYGENNAFSDSVRAIAEHKILPQSDILAKPGECDLSAYVDFKSLAQAATKVPGIKVSQVLPQGFWLESMGINTRLDVLCRQANLHQEKQLQSQVDRLVGKDSMGEIFKFMAIWNKKHGELFPFVEETEQIYY